MTRKEFNDFLKHKGRVIYRGRTYKTDCDAPMGEFDSVYMQNVSGSGWFVATKQELLANCYVYVPNEEQIILDGLADIMANTIVKVRRSGHKKQRSARKV